MLLILTLSSCNQKTLLEFKDENKYLNANIIANQDSIKNFERLIEYNLRKSIQDSFYTFLYGKNTDSILIQWSNLIPHNSNKFGRIHQKYSTKNQIGFIKKSNFDEVHYIISNSKNSMEDWKNSKNGHISLNAKEPGMYFIKAQIDVRNLRTGVLNKYPIKDSIYILKN